MNEPAKNSYLEDVLQAQEQVVQELKRPKIAPPAAKRRVAMVQSMEPGGGGPPATDHSIDIRVNGWWRWKTVVVPPNVYVVHTRRGHPQPIHIGMGISFRFNPYTDAFLVVPATMQTIVINARCICKERQGILVQAYLQWIVDDINTAYRRLDFSDVSDPMRIVSVQLREQAEAAIKDKVATMSIDDILTDKQPIIEELTHRLRSVAEGKDSGLGLKIVTVQIKEAVVSSSNVWENLQRPFRAEQEKLARLAVIQSEQAVHSQELSDRRVAELARLTVEEDLARAQHDREVEAFNRKQSEQGRRHQLEQEAEQRRIAERATTERVKREKELEVTMRQMELDMDRIRAQVKHVQENAALEEAKARAELAKTALEIERMDKVHASAHAREAAELDNQRIRQEIDNAVSPARVEQRLVELLPTIAEKAAVPDHVERVHISTDPGAPEGMASLMGLVHVVRNMIDTKRSNGAPIKGE